MAGALTARNRTGITGSELGKELGEDLFTKFGDGVRERTYTACGDFLDAFLDLTEKHFGHPADSALKHISVRERFIQAALNAWSGWCGDSLNPETRVGEHRVGATARTEYLRLVKGE